MNGAFEQPSPANASQSGSAGMRPRWPRISFITAVHNDLAATRDMVRTFQETVRCDDFEFLFVNDASSDGSASFLAGLPSPFRLINNETSLGFAGANNRGAREAQGDCLVFLNNDLIFDRPWLEPLVQPLADTSVGAVGNIQFNPATGRIDHAGMFFDRDGMPRQARKHTLRLPKEDYREWSCLSAACLAVRRSTFLKQGGFDEAYQNGCEDADFAVRLRQEGYRLLVANHSRIWHRGGSSVKRHQHNAANEHLFLDRWAPMTRSWARSEWPREYLIRYSRHPWKLAPLKTLHALLALGFCPRRPGSCYKPPLLEKDRSVEGRLP